MPAQKILIILFFTFFLSSHAALATEYLPECRDMKYVSEQADVIVYGDVIKVESKFVKRTIFTYVDFKVSKYIKGQGNDIITLKQFGGTVGKETQEIPGLPKFLVGQSGYLYLHLREDQSYDLVCGYGVKETAPEDFRKIEQ